MRMIQRQKPLRTFYHRTPRDTRRIRGEKGISRDFFCQLSSKKLPDCSGSLRNCSFLHRNQRELAGQLGLEPRGVLVEAAQREACC